MTGVLHAAIVGIATALALVIWISTGYLVQRFIFRNPSPDSTTVMATAMGTSIVLFMIVAAVTEVFR